MVSAARIVEQRAHAGRVFVVAQWTAEKYRHGQQPDLHQVTARVEARSLRRLAGRNAEMPPQLRNRQPEMLDAVCEDVLRDGEAALGRDHDAFGAEQAVRHPVPALVQGGQGRQQLPNQPHGSAGVRPHGVAFDAAQHLGEPLAGHELGHERKVRSGVVERGDAADAGEHRVAEGFQILDARAKRGLEPGHRREPWVQPQELQSRSSAVEQEQAITEAIGEAFRIPGNQVGLNGGGDRIPMAERTGYRCVDYHSYTSPWCSGAGRRDGAGAPEHGENASGIGCADIVYGTGRESSAFRGRVPRAHFTEARGRGGGMRNRLGHGSRLAYHRAQMGEALSPRRGTPEDQRVSELDLRLEQVAAALRQMRQATGSLQDLETRLSVMTTECAQILNRWAQNDERHAAAVLELHGRLSEWNDIERRLLHESTTRMHQFERSVQHEWQALRAKQEEPLKRLDADAARVTVTCLEAVDQALAGFARAESRLEAIEERLHREMGDLAREVRTALAEIGEQRPQVGERQPWSLDNVVRLHNELRAEPQGTVPGLALASSAGASTARALDRRPELPLIAAPAPADAVSRSSAGAAPFWRQRAAQALALAILVVGAGGLYLYSYVQAGVRDVASRAQAAERNAADARIAAGRELKAVRQHADERVASAEDSARRAQALGAILSASDLRRFDLIEGAAGSRAAQVLWSRSEGVAFSGPRLAAPPPGRIYQLWLTTPVTATSAGLVSVDSNGRANMTFAPPPVLPRPIVGASLTIEPIGGSTRPIGTVYLRSVIRDTVPPATQ